MMREFDYWKIASCLAFRSPGQAYNFGNQALLAPAADRIGNAGSSHPHALYTSVTAHHDFNDEHVKRDDQKERHFAPGYVCRWRAHGSRDMEGTLRNLGASQPILIVAKDRYPPFRVDIVDLYSDKLAKKYPFVWLMNADGPGSGGTFKNDREVFHVVGKAKGRFAAARQLVAFASAHLSMLRRVMKGEFALVQCRDTLLLSTAYSLAARWGKTPMSYWMSFPMEDSYIERGRARLAKSGGLGRLIAGYGRIAMGHLSRLAIYRFTLPRADAVFVQSRQMKNDVVAEGIAADKIFPVPMGVNTEKYDGPIAPLPDSVYGTSKVILYVGTLISERHLEIPGRGVAMVMRDNPDVIFAVIGRNTEAERAQLLAPFLELGVADRVQFQRHMPLAEVFGHIRRAQVCLSPYPPAPKMMASATPTKIVEYVYLGAQIVANHHPDQYDVLSGAGSGVLTDFTAEGFAQGIAQALDAPADAETATRMAQWVRDNRSYTALAAEVASVYDKLLARQTPLSHPS